MNTLVIDGHPNPRSLTAAVATAYADGHGAAHVLALRDLTFDPNLRYGYTAHMPLEPDLADAKRAMHAATRIVITTPLWWGSITALLKGFFDRALLPNEEYTYRGALPQGLLRGRRGRIFVLADTPRAFLPVTGFPLRTQVRRNTLGLVGVRPAPVHAYLGVRAAGDTRIARWLEHARAVGAKDGRADAKVTRPTAPRTHFADEVAREPAHR